VNDPFPLVWVPYVHRPPLEPPPPLLLLLLALLPLLLALPPLLEPLLLEPLLLEPPLLELLLAELLLAPLLLALLPVIPLLLPVLLPPLLVAPPLELLADVCPLPEDPPASSRSEGAPSGPKVWVCEPSSEPLLASYPLPWNPPCPAPPHARRTASGRAICNFLPDVMGLS
jgi:hypothetical protein